MTIIYQYKVASTSVCGFLKLLRRWRGSVYKLMFKEMLIFCVLYATISIIYRLALNEQQRSMFAAIAHYCNSFTDLIPVSFVLGFYVSFVVTRWWEQFNNVPWPDRTLFIMSTYLQGQDERDRILRRTVARYMMFGLILILRSISVAVMKRFPTLEHIVDAGFITTDEAQEYEKVCCKYNKFWVPLVWASNVLAQARREGRIESEIGFRLIMEYLADFRDKCSLCFVYDWITIPLVYTQVVTLSVYIFFLACLIGRQYVDRDNEHPDLYVPFFTLLQFFCYMGWLKVAEQSMNPFGEDDDDFNLNWLLDRHAAVAMCLADQCNGSYPTLVKDVHFNEIVQDIPYTEASKASRQPNFLGSTYNLMRPSIAEQRVIAPIHRPEAPVGNVRPRSNTSRYGFNRLLRSFFGYNQPIQRSYMSESLDTMLTPSVADAYSELGPSNHVGDGSLHPPLQRESYDQNGHSGLGPANHIGFSVLHPPLHRESYDQNGHSGLGPANHIGANVLHPLLHRESYDRESNREGSEDVGGDASPLLNQGPGDRSNVPTSQPKKIHRFTIETVSNDQEVDSSKVVRNKTSTDKHIGGIMSGLSVSRPPPLSSIIEEGNTVRSNKKPDNPIYIGPVHELKEKSDDVINEDPSGNEVFLEKTDWDLMMTKMTSHNKDVTQQRQKPDKIPGRRYQRLL